MDNYITYSWEYVLKNKDIDCQKALDNIESTKIIIAHRISAVSNADEIIFLEKGRIKERGTHNQLMKKKGLYYKTYVAQYGA